VPGHAQQMQFMLKAEITLQAINSLRESAMARFIRLIICAAFSAGYALKHVQHERLQ
jgi:hypothetical protein